ITLYCHISILNYPTSSEIGFKLTFDPLYSKDEKGFMFSSLKLVTNEGEELLHFELYIPEEGNQIIYEFGNLWELATRDMDALGQFLLDIAYNISNYELPEEIREIFTGVQNKDLSFYDWHTHGCKLYYICNRTIFNNKPFNHLLEDGSHQLEDITLKGLILMYSSDNTNITDLKEEILLASHEKEDVKNALNLSFEAIRNTLKKMLLEISNVFFLDRRLIGFSQKRLSIKGEGEPRGGVVGDFLTTYNAMKVSSSLDFDYSAEDDLEDFHESFKRLGFRQIPNIIRDADKNEYRILIGDENLRNSGMGYWSLTFVLYSLLLCRLNRKYVIIIEEPELNLHPDLQAELMDVLIDFSQKWGITIIMETHSEYMLRRLQLRVHEGGTGRATQSMIDEVNKMLLYNNFRSVKIQADKVVINSFERSKHGDNKEKPEYYCNVIRLDELGYMDKPLPPSFSSVAANDAMILNWWLNNRIDN
ncbi:MAG: AAA family ATPase, partial [Bacteroidota bacterium]